MTIPTAPDTPFEDQEIQLKPPVARKLPRETRVLNRVLKDDYAWLREKNDPEVAKYLEAENAYTNAVMRPTLSLQETLYRELLSHIKETDTSAPYPKGDYLYYTRTEEGKQYPILCRKKGVDAQEEITLDVNQLAEGQKYMALGAYEISDDGKLLAYSTDNTGFRQYRLFVKDLTTGEVYRESFEKTGSVVWANDNKTLFYTVEDAAKRHYRLYRHKLGDDPQDDVLVYEEPDEHFELSAYKSRSGRYIFLEIASHTTSEVRFVEAFLPEAEFQTIAPRLPDQEYYVDHRGALFYIRTNRDGRTFGIVTAPISTPGREHWSTLIAQRDAVMIEGLELFSRFMVRMERSNGLQAIMATDLETGEERQVKFPDAVYALNRGPNEEFASSQFRYMYQSPVSPVAAFDFDMETGEPHVRKQNEVPGGFDKNHYAVERIFATAKDGVRVPISVFFRRDVLQDGSAPLYLYGYGSYGHPLPVSFSANRLALLDRGVVIALAHIRGGGDMGKPWHDDGRMLRKINTFTDFIAVAEHLIAQKYTSKGKIIIEGGSAGGLLVGAVSNIRPELWKAVVSKVPFVDVMNTLLDASLPLTVGEYDEWGNPNEQPYFDYMLQYSPYDNLAEKHYPAMLVKTSFHDSQVMYWEPAKYVAKLRTLKKDNNVLLLKTNMNAGHGGASGRYDYLREVAFDYAFMLQQWGMAISS